MALERNINNGAASARLSLHLTVPPRVSMDFFYGQTEDDEGAISPEPQDLPPSYEPVIEIPPLLRRKFNIQPREDEGREVLPAYSCAISLESVFIKKMEVEGAVHRAHDRNWYRVFVTLQGTALTLHNYKSSGLFAKPEDGRKSTPDLPAGAKRGSLVKSYNLQHAEVGVAADYTKKKYVIRVRAEADQFLLSCNRIETFILWLQSLFAAIDLAPPLDDRDLPRDLSAPQPRRRRPVRVNRNIDLAREDLVREQREIITTQFPSLADPTIPEEPCDEDEISPVPDPDSSPEDDISPALAEQTSPPRTLRHRGSIIPLIMGVCTSAPNTATPPTSNPTNPSISPSTGKWAPSPPRTPWTEMQYAKRCMAILTCRAPRKSNLVIMKGKRWVVDWATGRATKWVPPATEGLPGYEDVGLDKIIAENEREEIWRVG
ncbi:Spectrin beta chain, partial [Lachnellula suecica]